MKNRIRIIAPAGPGRHRKDLTHKLQSAIDFLKNHNFIISVQDDIFADEPEVFYANILEKRLEGLSSAILCPDIDIIFPFTGGYGCGEIAEACIDIRPGNKKILMGSSDITVLHTLFNQVYNLPSIHGPVLMSLVDKTPDAIKDIVHLIDGKPKQLPLTPLNDIAQNNNISGALTGGNLTMMTTLIGTKLHPMNKGKILLLEDIAEPGYKIVRMLNHLEKAGLLKDIHACILADFTNSDENLSYAIQQFVDLHPNLPIFKAEGIGHGYVNHPVVFGSPSTIKNNILEFQYIAECKK